MSRYEVEIEVQQVHLMAIEAETASAAQRQALDVAQGRDPEKQIINVRVLRGVT